MDIEGAATSASTTFFTATLDGDQEVPATTTDGTGTGAFRLDDEGLQFVITVTGLSGDITGAHFHGAAAGATGVVYGIGDSFSGNTARGIWRSTDGLTSEMIGDLLAGNIYVNIHTANNPGGEIRGQVLVATGVGFWGDLTVDQEVSGSSGSGSGSAAMILDGDGLHYWVTVDDLTGSITGAHFHNAPAGANGGVVHGIDASFSGNTGIGVWGTADLTSELLGELLAGNIYINIHTAENAGGEVRGQVEMVAGVRMISRLSGDEEVPSVTVDGSGTAVITFDGTNVAFRLTVTGLTGPLTGAHFHNGAAGATGGVVRGITDEFVGNTVVGTWKPDDDSPLTATLIKELLAGNLYLNVHTSENPSGEIRGQLTASSGVGFIAGLDGDQENPAVEGDGSGTAGFLWDGSGLQYWVTVDGLTDDFTAAHFHNAPAGTNGGVVRDIGDSFDGNSAAGTWAASDASSLTSDLIGELMMGNLYLNVHTAANPSGEIRGQIGKPDRDLSGLVLSFARSISGVAPDFAWSGLTGSDGTAQVTVTSGDAFRFRRIGANGYYLAQLAEGGGRVIGTWGSIPIRGGFQNDLDLAVGARVDITGRSVLDAAGKVVVQWNGEVPALRPSRTPTIAFGEWAENGSNLLLPLSIERGQDIAGADIEIAFDSGTHLVAIEHRGERLAFVSEVPGHARLALDRGFRSSDQINLIFTEQPPTAIEFGGLFFDSDLMPVAIVDLNVRFSSRSLSTALHQNYPNPFNPTTQIHYDVGQDGPVRLTIFNALGQKVRTLVDSRQDAGSYTVSFDAVGISSGIYYVQMTTDGFRDVRKMMLLK